MCGCAVLLLLQVEGMISATYDDFLSAVARGRSMSKEAVRAVAKGRVWSGAQAMEVG
jgi:protease-4